MTASGRKIAGSVRTQASSSRARTALRWVEFAAIGALTALGPAQWLLGLVALLRR